MKKIFLYLLCLAAASACDDFFEVDISKRRVEAIAPGDGTELTEGKVGFRWNRLRDATGYRFTLLTARQSIVADTLIFADTLSRSYGCTLALEADEYQWSVYAFNAAYETQPEVRSLTVIAEEPEEPAEP